MKNSRSIPSSSDPSSKIFSLSSPLSRGCPILFPSPSLPPFAAAVRSADAIRVSVVSVIFPSSASFGPLPPLPQAFRSRVLCAIFAFNFLDGITCVLILSYIFFAVNILNGNFLILLKKIFRAAGVCPHYDIGPFFCGLDAFPKEFSQFFSGHGPSGPPRMIYKGALGAGLTLFRKLFPGFPPERLPGVKKPPFPRAAAALRCHILLYCSPAALRSGRLMRAISRVPPLLPVLLRNSKRGLCAARPPSLFLFCSSLTLRTRRAKDRRASAACNPRGPCPWRRRWMPS